MTLAAFRSILRKILKRMGPDNVKEIFLIRHGRQDSRLCNVDVPLDETGREQARLLGRRLEHFGLEKLYSSELLRAKETAEIINQYVHLPYEILVGIQEINFGGLTGKSEEEIRSLYADFREERSRHQQDIPYPDGGESGEDVVRRVMPVLKEICQRKENRVGIVTHGGVIRSVLAFAVQTSQSNKLKFGIDLENTSLTEVLYDAEREFFFLERFNDYAHIEEHPELLRRAWVVSLEKKGENHV